MKHQASKILATIFFLLLGISVSIAQAQSPQETLNKHISDLQKNPNDYTLREKIIKLVQNMSPAPVVPEEAKKYVNRGVAAGEGAKTENDYKDAIDEFQKAVNIAPWLGAGYRGLAVMQDKAGQYSQALQNLKLFLLTNPSTADTEAAKTLRDKIEYRQEKAAKESSPAAKRQTEEDFIQKLNGVRYVLDLSTGYQIIVSTLDIRGNKIIKGVVCLRGCDKGDYSDRAWHHDDETTLNGREFSLYFGGRRVCGVDLNYKAVENGKISDDGYTITTELCGKTIIYRRER